MDDPQRRPSDSDRDDLAARIRRAADEGRIGMTDRDIRLGNVRSATSMAELGLMTRELDQLDAALPPPPTPIAATTEARPWSRFEPGAGRDAVGGDVEPARVPARARGIILLLVVAVAVVTAGVTLVGLRATLSNGDSATVEPAVRVPTASPSTSATTPPSPSVPPAAAYSLTGPGIRGFLRSYRQQFGTSRAVDLTLLGEYAIANVPGPGTARQSGWRYSNGDWTAFGGVRAVFPLAQVLDTAQLSVPALVRNLGRARTTLNVERPVVAYAIVRSIRTVDAEPVVLIHVANQLRESGYLATTLGGRVLRAYPYGP